MEGPISFWGYKEQESNLILPEHDDDANRISNVMKIHVLGAGMSMRTDRQNESNIQFSQFWERAKNW
jgi:hypothetical protein